MTAKAKNSHAAKQLFRYDGHETHAANKGKRSTHRKSRRNMRARIRSWSQ